MIDTASPLASELNDPAQELRARQLARMETLADQSMQLADEYRRKAIAVMDVARTPEEAAVSTSYSQAFHRAAGTVRQCTALEMRICDRSAAVRAEAAVVRAEQAQARGKTLSVRRMFVGQAVRTAIDAQRRPRPETENLLGDLYDRLDETDEEDFLTRPVGEVAQAICEALDVPVDPGLWKDAPWAPDEITRRPRGSPFAFWRPGDPPKARDDRPIDPMARPP